MRMSDIAKKLGISAMTVSRALKQDASVAPDTRAAVLKAIEEMGYVPNQIAGSLSSNRSGFIAVLVPSLNNSHFSETVLGLGDVVSKNNLQLLIGNTDYSRDQETKLVRAFLARKPEAVILTSDGHSPETIAMLSRAKVPVIEIWDLPDKPIRHVVGFSNRSAMREMVQELLGCGYRHPVYLGETDDAYTRGAARRQGYLDALEKDGTIHPRMWSVGNPPATMSDGYKALDDILKHFPETDLIICVSDPLAFGVQSACMRKGLRIPEDIAIAGFGNFEISRNSVPAISTVVIDAREIGRATGEIIVQLLDQPLEKDKAIVRTMPAIPTLRESAPALRIRPT